MRPPLRLLFFAACGSAVFAQGSLDNLRELVVSKASKLPVSEVRLRADPEARVRPLETLVIQALIFGENEAGEAVRIQTDRIAFRLQGDNSGRLSKPFRYQGKEEEAFYRPGGRLSAVLQQGTAQYALQDSALYAAPEKEGKYTVVASAGGKEALLEIEVTNAAPSRLPTETTSFGQEARDNDPYRALAERYAPFVAQEAWFEPKFDYLGRFDLDGDFRGDNNWENAPAGSSQAYVYYTAMETGTHWFLLYNFFHARDYSDKCVIGTCHENDNEGLILTVQKDGSPFGRLRAMETLAHNNIYSYTLDKDVKKGVHDIDGKIDLYQDSHPMIFIEAGGHGVLAASAQHSYFDAKKGDFKNGLGVTYVYKGRAERPRHANDREVGYELLPIWEHWWERAHVEGKREEAMFDAYYSYRPVGVRPVPRYAEIAGSFLGRAQSENKAKPFWGWHDNKTRKAGVLATGQWALDPAYSTQVNLKFSEKFAVDYLYNPYLGVGSGPTETLKEDVVLITESGSGGDSGAHDGASPVDGKAIVAPQPGDISAPVAVGTLDYEAVVEGEAILSIRGDQVEVVTGAPRDPKVSVSAPIPPVSLSALAIAARSGHADVLAEPSASNRHATLVRVRPDGKRGKVRFRLEWAR